MPSIRPSLAQQKLLDRIIAGGRLSFDSSTGRYQLLEQGQIKAVDQRPVLVMLRKGLLFQNMSGICRLSY